jgi:hypothetical protein
MRPRFAKQLRCRRSHAPAGSIPEQLRVRNLRLRNSAACELTKGVQRRPRGIGIEAFADATRVESEGFYSDSLGPLVPSAGTSSSSTYRNMPDAPRTYQGNLRSLMWISVTCRGSGASGSISSRKAGSSSHGDTVANWLSPEWLAQPVHRGPQLDPVNGCGSAAREGPAAILLSPDAGFIGCCPCAYQF